MINTKSNLKHRLMAVRFAIWDLHLYLDTHMGDCAATELIESYKKKYLDGAIHRIAMILSRKLIEDEDFERK